MRAKQLRLDEETAAARQSDARGGGGAPARRRGRAASRRGGGRGGGCGGGCRCRRAARPLEAALQVLHDALASAAPAPAAAADAGGLSWLSRDGAELLCRMRASRRHLVASRDAGRAQARLLAATHAAGRAMKRPCPRRAPGGEGAACAAAEDEMRIAQKLVDAEARLDTATAACDAAAHKARFVASQLSAEEAAAAAAGTGARGDGGCGGAAAHPPGAGHDCPICFEPLRDAAARALLPCSHSLCVPCFRQLASRPPPHLCPECRQPAPRAGVTLVAAPQHAGAAAAAPADAPPATRRATSALPGASPAAAAAGAALVARLSAAEASVKLVGAGAGTKLDAIVTRVVALKTVAPTDRVLVFSEWAPSLRMLKAALAANGVKCASAAGSSGPAGRRVASAVAAFLADTSLFVLLLPLASGANGINLTAACHVVFVEPSMDAGAEAQAAKRVDRIGQDRPTAVHRFVVAGTVEARVRALAAARAAVAAGGGGGAGTPPRLRAGDLLGLLEP